MLTDSEMNKPAVKSTTLKSIKEVSFIFTVSAVAYLLIEYSSHATDFPSASVPQLMLTPLLISIFIFDFSGYYDMLDVDIGGIAYFVRALAFAIIALLGIWPILKYITSRSKFYLTILISVWLWYAASVAWVIFYIWAMSNSGWTD